MLLHDDVIDAALDHISANAVEVEVRKASSGILVSAEVLTAGNFGSPTNNSGSGNGRKIECLTSSASDMKSIAVDAAGAATKVALLNSAGVKILVVADIASAPISLLSTDLVNLGTFDVIIKDPA